MAFLNSVAITTLKHEPGMGTDTFNRFCIKRQLRIVKHEPGLGTKKFNWILVGKQLNTK